MEVNGQLHAPVALLQGKQAPGTHCIRIWVNPRANMVFMQKEFLLPL
jgi:hypothetical protein